ncbi:virulence factor TspB C-terminal domain-related protein [Kingella negevensis]|uniref:virulence factor TspB C-terminal domain-related protein n=1 Tax=Kingella negevensis TaxID=1522312 RepID=UPI00050A0AE1|nr:virulence factor TspB C-terminal domain-related protein [Kingella negevensis]
MRYSNLLLVAALMPLFLFRPAYSFVPAVPLPPVPVVPAPIGGGVIPGDIIPGSSGSGGKSDISLDCYLNLTCAVVDSVRNAMRGSNSSDSSNNSVGSGSANSSGSNNSGGSTPPPSTGNGSGTNGGSGSSGSVDATASAAIIAWRDKWVHIFNSMNEEAKSIKDGLARDLVWCANVYQYGSDAHAECSEYKRKLANDELERLRQRIDKAKELKDKEFQELQKKLNVNVSVGTPNVNVTGGGVAAGVANGGNNQACKINGVWMPCSGVGTSNNPDLSGLGSAGVAGIAGTGSNSSAGSNTNVNNNTATNTNTNTNVSNSSASTNSSVHSTTSNSTVNNITNNYGIQELPKTESMSDFCKTHPNSGSCVEWSDDGLKSASAASSTSLQSKVINIRPSGFFTGSIRYGCPKPEEVKMRVGNFSLAYDGLCEFASRISPFVIITFYILTAFSVLKFVRR